MISLAKLKVIISASWTFELNDRLTEIPVFQAEDFSRKMFQLPQLKISGEKVAWTPRNYFVSELWVIHWIISGARRLLPLVPLEDCWRMEGTFEPVPFSTVPERKKLQQQQGGCPTSVRSIYNRIITSTRARSISVKHASFWKVLS